MDEKTKEEMLHRMLNFVDTRYLVMMHMAHLHRQRRSDEGLHRLVLAHQSYSEIAFDFLSRGGFKITSLHDDLVKADSLIREFIPFYE